MRLHGRIQEFWKEGPGKPQTERRRCERRRGASPENFEKLDAISCNLAYIFGLGYHSKLGLCRTKNSGHMQFRFTHAYTPHTSKNSSDFGHYKIQIQFQTYFSDIVYNVENNKIDFAKNMEPGPPLDPPLLYIANFSRIPTVQELHRSVNT